MIQRAEEVKSISVRLFAPVRIDKIVLFLYIYIIGGFRRGCGIICR